ncbi:hypothetical protein SAMN05444397_10355 [Flavobacterium aquidurense]|uniref:Redox-active disulfide protein 2 n=1 Tax=Flavobacterium frigidimaris TaxID=262320 RepID=A0ABX4BU20_FLAFR|nr:hypothetical protein [Flavobacterium frigidimaris]OXA81305.1 hypothetical protein B0A65_03360 [Flavobacterium frigidimaris]SDZ00835.1 hypothetical protein SAMN05444397_10355 [Flavobacterium aquidurense]
MKKSIYRELTNEELLKKRDLFKGVSIGFGVIFMLAITVMIYLFTVKGSNVAIALIPVFILPVTFVPLLLNFTLVNKEIKLRNL